MQKTCCLTIVVLLLLLSYSYALDRNFEDQVKMQLQVENVLTRFSSDCGPGTILSYTKKGGYIVVANPWDALGITRDEYKNKWTEPEDIGGYISESSKAFEAKINCRIDTETMKQDKVRVKLSLENGKKYKLKESGAIYTIYDKIFSASSVSNDINIIRNCKNDTSFWIVREAYAYDLDYSCEWKKSWTSIFKLPEEIFKEIAPQIGIGNVSSNAIQSSGKGYFIAFNGLPINLARQ